MAAETGKHEASGRVTEILQMTGSRPTREKYRWVLSAATTAAVVFGVFWWGLWFVLILLVTTAKMGTTWGTAIPPYFYGLSAVAAGSMAGLTGGMAVSLRAGRSHSTPVGYSALATGVLGAAAATSVLALLGVSWLQPLRAVPSAGWWVASGAIALAFVFLPHTYAHRLAGAADGRLPEEASLGPPKTVPHHVRSLLKLHMGVLVAIWLVGGWLSYGWPQELFIILGVTVFVVHSYPLMTRFPTIRWANNLGLVVPGLYFLWVALRDAPAVLAGERLKYEPVLGFVPYSPLVYHPFMSLSTPAAAAMCAVAAVAAVTAISAATGARPRPDYRSALRHGGAALLILAPFALVSMPLQQFPTMLLLLLYSYYLFANGADLRGLMRWVVLTASWVPIVGLWQYGSRYFAAAADSSSLPPLWVYQIGDDADPFMWHEDVAIALLVTLVLLYGLLRTSRGVGERRFLVVVGSLMAITFVLTFTRGAWVALAVVAVGGSVWIGGRRRWIVPALVVGIAAGALVPHALGVTAVHDWMDRAASVNWRVDELRTAWGVFAQHPVLGVSPWEFDQLKIADGQRTNGFGLLHFTWAQAAVQGGLIGVGMLAVLVAAFAGKVRRAVSTVGVASASDALLMKCCALAVLGVAVCACFCCTLAAEGLYFVSILLGALLGFSRAHGGGALDGCHA